MTQIRLGVLGLGEAAQILHIPALRQLPELFTIAAVHDAAPSVTAAVAAMAPGAVACDTVEGVLPLVDAVLIVGPNAAHASHAIAALQAGKHVMIEKPMCQTMTEAEALLAAQKAAGKIVQIGYMRRHAPAFEEAVELVKNQRDRITYARVRDIIGMNDQFIAPTSHVHRGVVPASADLSAQEAEAIRSVAGTDTGPRALLVRLLQGLSTHDLSAMREMLGMPKNVLNAHFRQDGRFFTVQFDYGNFICQFETGIDRLARFDAGIEVLLPDMSVNVIYDTPYIRNQPARLEVTRQHTEHGVAKTLSHPTRQDSFVPQWQRFHASITTGALVKTDITDAMDDLRLINLIMQKMEG